MAVDNILHIISNVVITLGIVFMLIGAFGIFKLKDFYPRILVASKVDTVGMLTIIAGFIIRSGISFFSGKLVLIAIILIILNPLVAHIMVRSSYNSGNKVVDEDGEEKE